MRSAQMGNGNLTKSWRYDRTSSAQRGYGSRWQKARFHFLQKNPLCVYCKKQGKVTSAEVVDHIKPHKGDQKLFWDVKNWQSLCKHCHDSIKKREEFNIDRPIIGLDGYPIVTKVDSD